MPNTSKIVSRGSDTEQCGRGASISVVYTFDIDVEDQSPYRGADKSLARAGRKKANVSVRMA